MKETQLRDLADEFLVPFIAGAQLLDGSFVCKPSSKKVARIDPCTIQFKGAGDDKFRLAIQRSQQFEPIASGKLTEIDVVQAFVDVVGAMQIGLGSWYHSDLRAAFPRRVVAKALGDTKEEQEFILTVFDRMIDWASQEYEGKAIPAAIGIDGAAEASEIRFSDVCKEEFIPVLTNGFDTMLVCSPKGKLAGFECLGGTANKPSFAPFRLAGVAEWTAGGRIAIALNRAGEILVFTHGELRFVRRRGRWHFLTHGTVVTQMRRPVSKAVRRAVYETCLDASFAKTGACVGVVTPSNMAKWKQVVTEKADWWWPATSIKAKSLELMTKGQRFSALDRRLRQELVAIDGATVLDDDGRILAVGAILKIDGGSSGGGRLAAAKELSKLGLGIKVSQDGGIRGFHDGDKEAFTVM